jgi:hypothetical protein
MHSYLQNPAAYSYYPEIPTSYQLEFTRQSQQPIATVCTLYNLSPKFKSAQLLGNILFFDCGPVYGAAGVETVWQFYSLSVREFRFHDTLNCYINICTIMYIYCLGSLPDTRRCQIYALKVHKNENFFGSDFISCTFS